MAIRKNSRVVSARDETPPEHCVKRKTLKVFAEQRSLSYGPLPDALWGRQDRAILFAELKMIAASAFVTCCTPTDGRHTSYMQRAGANRLAGSNSLAAEGLVDCGAAKRREVEGLRPVIIGAVKRQMRTLPAHLCCEDDLVSCATVAIMEHAGIVTKALASKITRNTVIDCARHERVARRGRLEPQTDAPNSEADPTTSDIVGAPVNAGCWSALWTSIKTLSNSQQDAVILRYWGGHETSDIAPLMGIGRRAVQSLLSRAEKSIKSVLNDVRFNGSSDDYVDVKWFRYYEESLNDPRTQILPAELFRFWVLLLCIANQNDGLLPDMAAIALTLHMPDHVVSTSMWELCSRGLFDTTAAGLMPNNWNDSKIAEESDTVQPNAALTRAAEWRCFVGWVGCGLSADEIGLIPWEIKDALDVLCPGFLESEGLRVVKHAAVGDHLVWPQDLVIGLLQWGDDNLFVNPETSDEWCKRAGGYPNFPEWRVRPYDRIVNG